MEDTNIVLKKEEHVTTIRVLNTKKAYLICINIPKHIKEKEAFLNKVELALKTLGLKNIRVIEGISSVFEIQNNN